MRALALALALIVAIACAGPARAQGGPVPFEDDLARLAEILGGLHYLRAVCGADEKQTWRRRCRPWSMPKLPREARVARK